MICSWCSVNEGKQIGKKAICWQCANALVKSKAIRPNEAKHLEMSFGRYFGESEQERNGGK